MDTSDSAAEPDISDIGAITRRPPGDAVRRQVIEGFDRGQGLRENARNTNLTIEQVGRILKLRQKSIIKKGAKKR